MKKEGRGWGGVRGRGRGKEGEEVYRGAEMIQKIHGRDQPIGAGREGEGEGTPPAGDQNPLEARREVAVEHLSHQSRSRCCP